MVNKLFSKILLLSFISGNVITKPYPPNFSRTPAKIMDPMSGASTWALGSQ